MSTAELIGAGTEVPRDALQESRRKPTIAMGLPVALGGAMLAVVLYAAFAHGAVSLPVATRVEVAIAALAAIAAAGWLWTGSLSLSAPRLALAGVALLGAFAIWSGITLFWSVAPDQTWLELNRALSYVIVLGIAIAIGASHARAVELVAKGFLAVALAVTAYGLGQKVLPGLHLAGVFSFNQTGPLPRLQEPLGYWNALGLFVAMGVPVALAIAVDQRASVRRRVAALAAVEVMLLVLAFTYSRGGVLALAAGLAAGVAVSGARLRSLLWLAVAALATVAPLVFGLTDHSLTAVNVPLAHREAAGGVLAAILLVTLLALVLAARVLLRLERSIPVDAARSRRIGRALGGAVGAAVLIGVLAVAFSSRGLDGTVTHSWKTFTATRATSNYDPDRLLSADSENRWVWWKEAAGAFSERPIGGWGAGSFGVVHLLFRRNTLTVQQPHSVPLQFLAETGIVGTVLAMGGLALLLLAAIRAVRRRALDSHRLLAAALLAGGVAYAIHCLYDWDWDIPAVTLPALLFLGVLCGARRPLGLASAGSDGSPRSHPAMPRRAPGTRLAWLGAGTLWLCTFALSAALPSLAAGRANSALVQAASSSPTTLEHAQSTAALASSLDPLSDAGLRAEATIAFHFGETARARTYLLEAVGRDPSDAQAWIQLIYVELQLRDSPDAARAAERAIQLDPEGSSAGERAQVSVLAAPPQDSATATQTP